MPRWLATAEYAAQQRRRETDWPRLVRLDDHGRHVLDRDLMPWFDSRQAGDEFVVGAANVGVVGTDKLTASCSACSIVVHPLMPRGWMHTVGIGHKNSPT
jgi:hypothetical protein